jgi:hypothetical protein
VDELFTQLSGPFKANEQGHRLAAAPRDRTGPLHTPNMFNAAIRVLRVATQHGTKHGRSAASLLHLTPGEWIRGVQSARTRGVEFGSSNDKQAEYRLRQLQDVLVYPYHQGQWWELNVWNPQLDSRIPQREHEPHGRNVLNFSHLTSAWLHEGAKLWLSASLSTGTMTWSSVKTRLDHLKWLQRHIDQRGVSPSCVNGSNGCAPPTAIGEKALPPTTTRCRARPRPCVPSPHN